MTQTITNLCAELAEQAAALGRDVAARDLAGRLPAELIGELREAKHALDRARQALDRLPLPRRRPATDRR